MLRDIHRKTKRSRTGVASLKFSDGTVCHSRSCSGTTALVYPDGKIHSNPWTCPPAGQECHADDCDLARAVERLAAYEDTRMLPEEVAAMKKEVKRLRAKVKELKARLAEQDAPC